MFLRKLLLPLDTIYLLASQILPFIAVLKSIYTSERSAYSHHLTFYLVHTFFTLTFLPFLDGYYLDFSPTASIKILLRSVLYYLTKITLTIWLTNPSTMGARKIYSKFLEHRLRQHSEQIDSGISTVATALIKASGKALAVAAGQFGYETIKSIVVATGFFGGRVGGGWGGGGRGDGNAGVFGGFFAGNNTEHKKTVHEGVSSNVRRASVTTSDNNDTNSDNVAIDPEKFVHLMTRGLYVFDIVDGVRAGRELKVLSYDENRKGFDVFNMSGDVENSFGIEGVRSVSVVDEGSEISIILQDNGLEGDTPEGNTPEGDTPEGRKVGIGLSDRYDAMLLKKGIETLMEKTVEDNKLSSKNN